MRKYYYYTYKGDKFYGMGVVYSDDSCFPIYQTVIELRKRFGESIIIDFWKEISKYEFDNLRYYIS